MRISDWSSDVCSSDLLLHAAGRTHHEFIRQENREGLIPHDFACAPYCMSQAQRLLLPHEGGIARHQPGWGKDGKILAALRHGMFQLIGNIEMIFDEALSAPGDTEPLLNVRLQSCIEANTKIRPIH